MKIIIPLLATGILLGCRSMNWTPAESAVLPDFTPLKGQHCESSAMVNMLVYEGYEVSEQQILGAGAVLGFYYELSKFPFLGGRTLELKEHVFDNLGIEWTMGKKENFGDGWEKIHSLLQEAHPVVLRVDMRYLPYLYGGKYGPSYMSFGWHLICIAGIDAVNQTALVTDTTMNGLQTIKLTDLHRARFSDTRMMPPEGEFYWTEKAPADFNPDWEEIALQSMKIIEHDMRKYKSDEGGLTALDGLSKFPAAVSNLDSFVPPYLLSQVLHFNYGSIETDGTGGAAFRRMYHLFLQETAATGGNSIIAEAAGQLEPAVYAWKELAAGMKFLSGKKAALKNKASRREELNRIAQLAERVYETESRFYDFITNEIRN